MRTETHMSATLCSPEHHVESIPGAQRLLTRTQFRFLKPCNTHVCVCVHLVRMKPQGKHAAEQYEVDRLHSSTMNPRQATAHSVKADSQGHKKGMRQIRGGGGEEAADLAT